MAHKLHCTIGMLRDRTEACCSTQHLLLSWASDLNYFHMNFCHILDNVLIEILDPFHMDFGMRDGNCRKKLRMEEILVGSLE